VAIGWKESFLDRNYRWNGGNVEEKHYLCTVIAVFSFKRVIAMGTYINIGNAGFQSVRNGEYVDKSGLIAVVNSTLFIS